MKKIVWGLFGFIVIYAGACHLYNHYFSHVVQLSPQPVGSTCHAFLDDDSRTTVRILVVDGGGIDGVMPLVLLRYLEEKTGKPIVDLFDIFTGTSTGSIIVSGLNLPDKDGKPKYSAGKLLEFYENLSRESLTPSVTRKFLTLYGLIGPRLSVEHFHSELLRFGGNITFGELIKKEAVTVYDIERNHLEILNNWPCDAEVSRYRIADVVTAATATPTFFAPAILTDYKHRGRNALVDGMIFANNPSLDAIREAFALHPHAKRFIIVHLGTGGDSLANLKLNADEMQHWGFLHWVPYMIDILYTSQNTIIKSAISSIQNFSTATKFEYYYFNKNLDNVSPFDASKANIDDIVAHANAIITEQRQTLDKVAADLSNAS